MAVRQFTDANGVTWRVWSTVPGAGSPLLPYYPDGWLTFDCGDGVSLRRMAPPPPGWETAPHERLSLICRAAEEVPRHTGPMKKILREPADVLLADPGLDGTDSAELRPGA